MKKFIFYYFVLTALLVISCQSNTSKDKSPEVATDTQVSEKTSDNIDTTSIQKNNKTDDSSSAGYALVEKTGCVACHSLDGTKLVSPSFKGLFGSKTLIKGQGEVIVDENYIKESIISPNEKVVEGYNEGLMISYKDQLNDEEINQIIDYLKTLAE